LISIGNKALTGTVWLSLSNFVHIFLGGATAVFVARWLGPSQYGYVPLVGSILGLSMIITDAGISPSAARFLAEVQGDEQKTWFLLKRTLKLRVIILLPTCFGFFFTIDKLATFLNAPLLSKFAYVITLLLFLQTMQRWIAKVCEGTGNTQFLGRVKLSVDWLNPVLQLGLILLGFGLSGVFFGQTIAYSIIFGVFLFLIIRKFKITVRKKEKREADASIPDILGYAFPLMVVQASAYIFLQSDILMLKYFAPIQEVSYYGVAVTIINLIKLPAAAFGASTAPLILLLKKNSDQRASEAVFKSIRLLAVLFGFVALCIFVYAGEAVEVLFSASFRPAAEPLQIYSIFIFFAAISSFVSLTLDYSGLAKTRMVLISIFAVLNVVMNLLLIPKYGMIGAAWATQITYPPLVLLYIWLVARHFRIDLIDFFKIIFKIGTIDLLTYFILWWFPGSHVSHDITRLFLGVPLGAGVYFSIAFKFNLIKKTDFSSLVNWKSNA